MTKPKGVTGRPPRPPAKELRDRRVVVLFTPSEVTWLQKCAKREKLAGFVRWLALREKP